MTDFADIAAADVRIKELKEERDEAREQLKYFGELHHTEADRAKGLVALLETDRDDLLARVKKLEEERVWRSIKSAPRDGTPLLLVYSPDGITILKPRYGVGFFTSSEMLWDWGWSLSPTHWLPIPPPPHSNTGKE